MFNSVGYYFFDVKNYFLFRIIHKITGAPKSELMVLIGSVYVGICETISQISKSEAPVRSVAGSKILWLDVRKIPRAICGTATPTNAIGPVNAVMPPASKPVAITIQNRVRITETPKPCA